MRVVGPFGEGAPEALSSFLASWNQLSLTPTDKAARAGLPLRARVQLRSFDAVCRLVESGVGVGVVPATTAARAARTMALAIVDLEDDWAVRDLTIVVRSIDDLRPYARALVESLRV